MPGFCFGISHGGSGSGGATEFLALSVLYLRTSALKQKHPWLDAVDLDSR